MAKIELHAHTSRYSACSRMTPEEALHAAASKVDVLVLTEHNILWPQDELIDLQRQAPPHLTVLAGVEISTDLGHLLCYGLTELPHIEPDRTPATEIIALTHDAGGAVAVAHPFRWGNGDAWYDPKLAIDAVEIASSNTNNDAAAHARRLARTRQLRMFRGSDAHSTQVIGSHRQDIPGDIRRIQDVIAWLIGDHRK